MARHFTLKIFNQNLKRLSSGRGYSAAGAVNKAR
jgi:hypothetical protein